MNTISVILPIYNTEKYLKTCVESLRAQNYPKLEILLVDDGSTDSSGLLCDEYAQLDSRIKVVHKENGGLISAWTRGVRESSGSYLCFVDSDDRVDPEMITEMAEWLSGSEKEIIASDYVIERQQLVNAEKTFSQEYVYQQLPPGEYIGSSMKEKVIPNLLGHESRYVTVSRCMKLISRKLIEDNLHFVDPSIAMGEDLNIMFPALIDCERLVIMDHKAYYHYLYVTDSMVHKYDQKLTGNIHRLRNIIYGILEEKFSGKELKERKKDADRESIFLYLLTLKNEARGNPKEYRKNIKKICGDPEVKKLVKDTPVQIRQKANKLLYMVLKHPTGIHLTLLRLAMVWYYR